MVRTVAEGDGRPDSSGAWGRRRFLDTFLTQINPHPLPLVFRFPYLRLGHLLLLSRRNPTIFILT